MPVVSGADKERLRQLIEEYERKPDDEHEQLEDVLSDHTSVRDLPRIFVLNGKGYSYVPVPYRSWEFYIFEVINLDLPTQENQP